MAKGVKRSIYLYINGEEVENNIKSISSRMTKLINEQKKMTIGSDEYVAHAQKIKQLRNVIDEHNQSLKSTATNWDKLKANLGNIGNIVTGVTLGVQSVNQMIGSLKKMATDLAAMDDIYADVMKYTGMTREQVAELNEEFKKMDTRTSREELNRLAGEAGKLGIKGKENIMDFVETANIINVALGEDLGEDAVKNIGKMAEMFGETDRLGLRGAMLATGSAINTIGQESSASEPYLLEFTARLSGTANQAKITQAEVLGYASVLDQNMQQLEMSATAMQNLIMKMMQNPAKFAKMAGVEVSKFSNLLKTDANEAILTLIDSLSKRGGLSQLAPMFKEMGLDGVRASGVISMLANNIDKIREEQEKASKAYSEGTSAINEYNIKNNNLQAELEKARKKFQDTREELGKKLYPILINLTTTSAGFIKIISSLIQFIGENKTLVTSLVVAYVTYFAIMSKTMIVEKKRIAYTKVINSLQAIQAVGANLLSLAQAKLAKNTVAAAQAQAALKTATMATPWGAVIAAIGIIIGLFSSWIKKQNELTASQKTWNTIEAETSANYEKETLNVNKLVKAIHNENLANDARQAAINELKQIIPEYNAMISDEGKIINENKQAIEDYLESLRKKIKLQSVETQLKNAYEEEAKASKEAKKALKEYEDQSSLFFIDKLTKGWKSQKKSAIATEAYNLVTELETEFDKLYQDSLSEEPTETKQKSTQTIPDDDYENKYKAYLERLKEFRRQHLFDEQADFIKEIATTKAAYDEMIEEATKFKDKKTAIELGDEKQKAIEAIVIKRAKDLSKKINELSSKSTENQLLDAVAVESKKYNDVIDETDRLINSLTELNKIEKDPEIVKTIDELWKKRKDVIEKRNREINDIINKYTKDISDNVLSEHDKKNKEINDRYNKEIEIVKAAIEEKKKLGLKADDEEIKRLEELLKKMEEIKEKALKKAEKKSIWEKIADLLGIKEEDAKDLLKELENFYNSFSESFLKISANRNEKELNEFKKKQEAQREALQYNLDQGVLSQEEYNERVAALDKELNDKELQIKREQWKKDQQAAISQALINAALGITEIWAKWSETPYIAGVLTAISAAATAVQIAAIASEPEPYAKGGYIDKEKIIKIGEKGKKEWVASNTLVTNPVTAPIIKALDDYQKGKSMSFNSLQFSTPSSSLSGNDKNAKISYNDNALFNDDYEALTELKLLRKYMSDPKNRQSVISRKIQTKFESNENQLNNIANL